jgi:hypothetical protein
MLRAAQLDRLFDQISIDDQDAERAIEIGTSAGLAPSAARALTRKIVPPSRYRRR